MPVLERTLRASAASAAVARQAVAGLDLQPQLSADVTLLVSELVTNVVRHADLTEEDMLVLRVEVSEERVRVAVGDPGQGFVGATGSWTPGQSAGMGLGLVSRLSGRWGIERADRTWVWCEIDRAPARARSSGTGIELGTESRRHAARSTAGQVKRRHSTASIPDSAPPSQRRSARRARRLAPAPKRDAAHVVPWR